MQWTLTVANALGIARGAIDDLITIAATEASTLNTRLLRDRAMVQARVGEADAIVSAARAYVFDAIGRLWDGLSAGKPPPDHAVARARLAIVHGMHESARAVDKVFHAAGTTPPAPTRSTPACRWRRPSATSTWRCSTARRCRATSRPPARS